MKSLNKLVLSAVCLTVFSAPEASAEALTKSDFSHFSANQLFPEIEIREFEPPELEQLEFEQGDSKQQALEQQINALSAISYPNPFSDSEVSSKEGAAFPSANENSTQAVSSVLLTQLIEAQSVEERLAEAQSAADLSTSDQSTLAQSTGVKVPAKFGQAGKQRWYVQGGVGADFDDDLFGLVGAGVSHFFYNGHSINLELNGLAFDQTGSNAVGLNLALLVRSHWIRGENWSIYIDGGAGIIATTDDVPAAGSSFNFTPQIGGGATFAINDTQRIMTGLRWYHISNASLFESNPGLDALYGYVGYNFPF